MRASYKVVINPTDNGVVVRVGCKLLVFEKENISKFYTLLDIYLKGNEEQLRKDLFPEDFSNEPQGGLFPQLVSAEPETCCDPGGSDF